MRGPTRSPVCSFPFRRPTSQALPGGATARVVYVFPKYTLRYAHERPEDMLAVTRLALAGRDHCAVRAACCATEASTYDLRPLAAVRDSKSFKIHGDHLNP